MKRSMRKRQAVSSNLGSDADSSDSRNGSQDLFSSHASTDPLLNEQIDMTLQLTESVWVQCDKPECQKWRRVPVSESNRLSDVWYCDMNPDIKRNTCTAAEEDHALYDKMAKKAGIKYVMSAFNPGSLVWAKMAGYCSWPALITQDPNLGTHVIQDIDGDPHSYHVEFLGKPHTHSWVAAKFVDVYGYKKRDGQDSSLLKSLPGKHKKVKRGRQKKQNVSSQVGQREKTSYKRTNIKDVIVEADFLLHMDYADRLDYSIFRYMPEEENRNIILQCKKDPQKIKRGRKRAPSLSSLCHKSDSKPEDSLKTIKLKVSSETSTSKIEKSETPSGITQPCMFDSPDQFSQSKLKFLNTLADKSKEEKFRIDVDMYRRNEAAFEHDVRRFMTRHGQQIKSTPVWHNVPITLFQLYLSVNERGGFLQVTARKQWTDVYRELTEQQRVTTGAQAKKYYQQNVYPFELYITGKDYLHSLVSKRKKAKVVKPTPNSKTANPTNKSKQTASSKTTDSIMSARVKPKEIIPIAYDDQSSVTQDIERILDSLKEEDDVTSFHDWNQRKPGVKFHDEDTLNPADQRCNSVPSEFQSSQTYKMIHEVTNEIDTGSGLSDLEQKILHEMKALDDETY